MQVSLTSLPNNNTVVTQKSASNEPTHKVADNQSQKDEFKKISNRHIKDILETPQCSRSDCYLVSTLKALAKSGIGKRMLKESIFTNKDGDTFQIKFNKYKDATYKVVNDIAYTDTTGRPTLNTTGAVESATYDVVRDNLSAKPLLIRYFGYANNIEGNLASTYMEALTGKKPINIGDNGLRSLNAHKEETEKLLDKIADMPMSRHSFVAGSKLSDTKDGIGTSHYYIVKTVDKKNKTVNLVNPRYADLSKDGAKEEIVDIAKLHKFSEKQIIELLEDVENIPKVISLPYDKFMENFRSIVGYMDTRKK